MPRKPRMYLPGVPCHIVQRGNNREANFFSKNDYLFYLACLKDGSKRYGVTVHAYALMSNHVHLLLTTTQARGQVLQSPTTLFICRLHCPTDSRVMNAKPVRYLLHRIIT